MASRAISTDRACCSIRSGRAFARIRVALVGRIHHCVSPIDNVSTISRRPFATTLPLPPLRADLARRSAGPAEMYLVFRRLVMRVPDRLRIPLARGASGTP
ncbi:MAG: hypothetical protein AMS19_03560 [Gemmatimonas sp. SG8_23]|nr:MAG: hypothetical protein AMS19_03560 [Gemmatimonas sp. SG8_23]